jgi:UDP-N-acetylglucosamine acyltransferase
MLGVHKTAIVHPSVRLPADAVVGPYALVGAGVKVGTGCRIDGHAVLGEGVRLGARCVLEAHAAVLGDTECGDENVFHSFAVVGGVPQAKRHGSGPGRLVLGRGNVVREHATLHGGTEGRSTVVGDDNLFMIGSHVAHDVRVGSHCVLANGVQLAGHAEVDDYVTFGGLSGVAQFTRVGEGAFVAAGAMVERAVPPFVIVQGDRARIRALNIVGLRRRGVDEASIAHLEAAFRALFVRKGARTSALRALDRSDPYVAKLARALETSG